MCQLSLGLAHEGVSNFLSRPVEVPFMTPAMSESNPNHQDLRNKFCSGNSSHRCPAHRKKTSFMWTGQDRSDTVGMDESVIEGNQPVNPKSF